MSQYRLSVQDDTLCLFVRDAGYAWGQIVFAAFLGVIPLVALGGFYDEWPKYHPTVWYVTAILFMFPLCLLLLFASSVAVRKGLRKPVTTELCIQRSGPGAVVVTFEQSFLLAQNARRSGGFLSVQRPLAYVWEEKVSGGRGSRWTEYFVVLCFVSPSGEEHEYNLQQFHDTPGGASVKRENAARFARLVNTFVVHGARALDQLSPETLVALGLGPELPAEPSAQPPSSAV